MSPWPAGQISHITPGVLLGKTIECGPDRSRTRDRSVFGEGSFLLCGRGLQQCPLPFGIRPDLDSAIAEARFRAEQQHAHGQTGAGRRTGAFDDRQDSARCHAHLACQLVACRRPPLPGEPADRLPPGLPPVLLERSGPTGPPGPPPRGLRGTPRRPRTLACRAAPTTPPADAHPSLRPRSCGPSQTAHSSRTGKDRAIE